MKKNFLYIMGMFAALLMVSCEPNELDKPDVGTAISADQVTITVTPGSNQFKYVVKNTTPVQGISKWDFGNSTLGTGTEVEAYYPLPGTYTITLSIYTKAGLVTKTQQITTTATDYSIFKDPVFVNLSGGVDDLDGKTWVLDSLSTGHIGVGPAGSDGTSWWAANPLDKVGLGLYDDMLNFTLNKFVCTYTNHGKSYVKDFRASDPNYSNVVNPGSDRIVDFTPAPGTWFVQKSGNDQYLILSSTKPIYPGFDVGAVDNKYKILSLSENKLELVATGGDGNAWHYLLIPQGYVKPVVKADLTVTAGANINEYNIQLKNVVVPAGITIKSVVWTLGDGTTINETDINKVINHTYMRKSPYTVNVKVTTSGDPFEKSTVINVTQNSPDYVPYLLNMMVMYQDFGEVSLAPMAFDKSDGDGSIVTVANPDASRYPDKSAHVGKFTKINAQYANAYLQLPVGYRFNLTKQTKFKMLVYGKAGDKVLLKLENTDRGGNAWQTGAESTYTIQKDNTWEEATYDFNGVSAGWDWTGDIFTSNIATDSRFNDGFYNVVRIMYNPGDNSKTYTFYMDDLAGPHVEGLK